MNEDFQDFLTALLEAGARFLVVGAHALAVHGVPRATGDLDVWVDPEPRNVEKVWRALRDFGAPLESLDLSRDELEKHDQVVQFGFAPRRIDVMTGVSGLEFDGAWEDRLLVELGGREVPFLGRSSLIANKRAAGRLKDRGDLEELERGAD